MNKKEWEKVLKDYHAAVVASDRKDELNDLIKTEMKAAGIVTKEAGGFIAKLSTRSRTDLDKKALKADKPDVYANYVKTTYYDRLDVK